MRDLYKRLNVDEADGEGAIRSALGTAEPSVRQAAEFILLDAHRRRVYDRNRRLLMTVGELRSRMGLTLSPFWRRGPFGDFTRPHETSAAQVGSLPPPGQHFADPLEVLRAFDLRHGHHSARRRIPRLAIVWLCGLAIVILIAIAVWLWR